MKTINHYRIVVVFEEGILYKDNECTLNEVPVLKENDKRLCLDDLHFTTLSKEGEYIVLGYRLNEPTITINNKSSAFGTSIMYELYSDKVKSIEDIAQEIQERVDEEFGIFSSKLDLSFIDFS